MIYPSLWVVLKWAIKWLTSVTNPNKVAYSVIISIFEAKDSRQNLRICLEWFKAHIDKLMNLTWINRTLRIFMFGDYEFLSSMYGISGAVGNNPCIWCEISVIYHNAEGLQNVLWQVFDWDMKSLVINFRGNLKNTKKIFYVIVFFNIELTQVCLPGLYILVGVFLKIYTDVNGGTKINLQWKLTPGR